MTKEIKFNLSDEHHQEIMIGWYEHEEICKECNEPAIFDEFMDYLLFERPRHIKEATLKYQSEVYTAIRSIREDLEDVEDMEAIDFL